MNLGTSIKGVLVHENPCVRIVSNIINLIFFSWGIFGFVCVTYCYDDWDFSEPLNYELNAWNKTVALYNCIVYGLLFLALLCCCVPFCNCLMGCLVMLPLIFYGPFILSMAIWGTVAWSRGVDYTGEFAYVTTVINLTMCWVIVGMSVVAGIFAKNTSNAFRDGYVRA